MQDHETKQIESELHEINNFIHDAIKNGFLTDKAYEKIKAHIAKLDELFLKNPQIADKSHHLNASKNRLDSICEILDKVHPKSHNNSCMGEHKIVGDSFSDDNSFILSEITKSDLSKILI